MIGAHITTLGCKLNQFDSAELAGNLRGVTEGVEDPSRASLVIINTCTVTQAADSDARQLLRRRRRESPGALIVATGCYAERSPRELAAMPEVDLVLTREERPRAAEIILSALRERFPGELADGCADRVVSESLPDFGNRSRAFLRIQDGCNLVCTYCVIPRVRGASRSLSPDDAVRRFTQIIEAGFKEIVLTGVNTGDYGKDLEPRVEFADLLERLLALPGDFRIRLNSLEPRCVTPRLISLFASEDRLARHLQIPLQSGADAVLRAMRRNYRAGDYREIVETLRERVPAMAIGADVIVGFPLETDPQFEETRRFIESSPLNYLHVFSYSSRPETQAAGIPGHQPAAIISERSRTLRELGRQIAEDFRRSQMGVPHRALLLAGKRRDGLARALTSNFIEVGVPQEIATPNEFAHVSIDRLGSGGEACGHILAAA